MELVTGGGVKIQPAQLQHACRQVVPWLSAFRHRLVFKAPTRPTATVLRDSCLLYNEGLFFYQICFAFS